MTQRFTEFQVNAYTEREVQAFLDAAKAQDQYIEDWTGVYKKPTMEVIAWGTTAIPIKRLNRLADAMGVALISVESVKNFSM